MIIIIDNYDSFTYNLYQYCAEVYPQIEVVRNDKITLQELEKKNPKGIIISPGPGTPNRAGICIPLVQKFSGQVPILGVCLGHQAIGEAFGGKIDYAKQVMHGKSSMIFHSRQDLFEDVSLPFSAGRYHSLILDRERFPEDLVIQAETMDGIIMAIRHKVYPTFGIQFHPESILTHDGKMILTKFIEICSYAESLS